MRRTIFTIVSALALLATGVVAGFAVGGTGTVDPPPRIAFLANGIVPADALAAGGIAGQLGAPLFTTGPDTLDPAAETGLADYNPELVIVLGGPVAIDDPVIDEVEDATGLTYTEADNPDGGIVRVAGQNRFHTAAAVAKLLAGYNPAYLPSDATALGAVDADQLDGLDATAFQPAGDYALADQACAPGEVVTGIAADGTPTCAPDEVDGGDADTLDGLDSEALAAPAVAETALDDADALPFDGTDTALVTVDITLPDHCGDSSTRHRVLAYGSYMLYLNDNSAWVTGRMEIHNEADGATINGFLPYTGQLYLSSENGESDPLSTISEQRLFTNVEPGVVTYELLADVDTARTSTTSLAWNDPMIRVQSLGWTCGPHPVSQATTSGGESIHDAG